MERVGWDEFMRRPIGTGPYKVEGEIKDYRTTEQGEEYARLVANANYWSPDHPK